MDGTCLHCSKDFKYGHSSTGKYCSSKCAGDHKSDQRKQEWLNGTSGRCERTSLRRYLSEERGYCCEVCGLSEWQGQNITLQVDHINGDSSNDKPDNVRLICPNCHSQTEFLGAANKGKGRKSLGLPLY